VIAHDVTEIVESKQRIEHQEKQFRYVMQATNEGIWDWNVEKNTLTHNDKWYEILGYKAEELTHTIADFYSCFLPESLIKVQEKINECV
jgi:PAS domain S-box-containing protein